MQLTAVFEEWLLGDGTYPPLYRGQLVNLAFRFVAESWGAADGGRSVFDALGNSRYRARGTVLQTYRPFTSPLAVVEADTMCFYVESSDVATWQVGMFLEMVGDLFVDYYVWTESIADQAPSPPDLFYSLRVTRIRRVSIPERFVTQSEKAITSPTTVDVDEVTADEMVEVESMNPEVAGASAASVQEVLAGYRPHFFLVDFDDADIGNQIVPRTFIALPPSSVALLDGFIGEASDET